MAPDPTSATRVLVVRHGTTLVDRANRCRGHGGVPRDQGGWGDELSAASHLQDVGLEAISTSPLRRARDTARIVADGSALDAVIGLPGAGGAAQRIGDRHRRRARRRPRRPRPGRRGPT